MNFPAENPVKSQRTAAHIFLSPILFTGLRLFFGGLFIYSGAVKLTDTASFAQTICAYRLIPDTLSSWVAIGLPTLEIITGLGVLLNRRWAIWMMLGLMILFLSVLSYGVSLGLDIDCGCFSAADTSEKTTQLLPPPVALGLSGVEEPDAGFLPIVPGLENDEPENICSGSGGDPTRLRKALFRDIFLFFCVLYMAAWPGLRKKYGRTGRPSNVEKAGQSPETRVRRSESGQDG